MRHKKEKVWFFEGSYIPPKTQGNCHCMYTSTSGYSFYLVCLHKQNIWHFFGANNFQYNLHLSFFPVHIISNWLIHWGFHKFSSMSCLFPHLTSFVRSLFLLFPSPPPPHLFVCRGFLWSLSIKRPYAFFVLTVSKLRSLSFLLALSVHPQRVGCFYLPLLSNPVANALSETGKKLNLFAHACAHVHMHI